ncbi:MAG TPA: FecR family protein, partial [Candidatus Aquicultoraceae bacterium]|nr:FecR family protein [Candidatus Aquicultoraceae bacterium]
MKIFGRLFGSWMIAGLALAAPATSGADSLGAMRVELIYGDVQVRIAETGEWAPVSVNMPLVEGDELWVPQEGRASLQTSNGDHVRLDEGTALQVLRMESGSFQFYLAQGRAYVLSPDRPHGVLQVDTPDASVHSFGGSTFRVDVLDAGTDVSVLRGSVRAESDVGMTAIREGEMLALGPRGYAELSPLPPPDEWDRWNGQQDRIVLARGGSIRYLPA